MNADVFRSSWSLITDDKEWLILPLVAVVVTVAC